MQARATRRYSCISVTGINNCSLGGALAFMRCAHDVAGVPYLKEASMPGVIFRRTVKKKVRGCLL